MKIIFIITISIFILFIVFQYFIMTSTNKTEQQKYTLVHQYKDFEIRFYPSATIATINSDAKTYKELASPGFRKLAGYIFGGNEKKESIAMTSPVQMDINDHNSTMSFVMPSEYALDKLPKPTDPNVSIKSTKDEYVAVIKFAAYASDALLQEYAEKLKSLLIENKINSVGNFRFFGYNPPYQVVGRRNEIVIAVEWNK